MATDIDMASNALLLIGDNAISSFSDEGFGPTVMGNIYQDTYRSVLAAHPWSFALKEQALSQLTTAPDSRTGYKYQYQIPVDCIRIWEIMDHSDYDIIGDKLYSNLSSLLCRYVYAVTETQLPAHVVKTIEYKLAAEAAIFITENQSMASLFENKYLMQLAQAQAIDSSGRPQVGIVDMPFNDVRFNGTSNGSGY